MKFKISILVLIFITHSNSTKAQQPTKFIFQKLNEDINSNKVPDLMTGFYLRDFYEKGIKKPIEFEESKQQHIYLVKNPILTRSNFQRFGTFFDGKNWGFMIQLDTDGKNQINKIVSEKPEIELVICGHIVRSIGLIDELNSLVMRITCPFATEYEVKEIISFIKKTKY